MELKLNAILKEEAKKSITEAKRATYYGGKPTGTETDLYIGKTRVVIRKGVVQSEIPMDGPISEEIAYFIVGVRGEFTMHEGLLGITRAKGKYTLPEDAETTGTVEFYMNGVNSISCYGPTRENTLALCELIRNGNIRPNDEWDKEQITGGPDELTKVREQRDRVLNLLNSTTAELAQVTREVEELRSVLETARTERNLAQDRVMQVRKLSARLDEETWPWCSKSAVATMINLAVNGASEK
jgi:hypothetical protein